MIPPQIWKPFAIFLAIIVIFLFARGFVAPPSFGLYGHYRGDALAEIASKPIHYAGKKSCYDCHDQRVDELNRSKHANQSCETCHGPSETHVEDPSISPPFKLGTNDWCLKCHGSSVSRPKDFPQVVFSKHYPGKDCISCHNPHHPEKP